jgi:hypothetical protein
MTTQTDVSKVLANLRKRAISMVITPEEFKRRKKEGDLKEFFYCKKIQKTPFNKGSLLGISEPKRDMVYCFAKQYAFYLSKEYGLVKILNFKNDLKFGFKIYHKNDESINFDESNLVLIKDN